MPFAWEWEGSPWRGSLRPVLSALVSTADRRAASTSWALPATHFPSAKISSFACGPAMSRSVRLIKRGDPDPMDGPGLRAPKAGSRASHLRAVHQHQALPLHSTPPSSSSSPKQAAGQNPNPLRAVPVSFHFQARETSGIPRVCRDMAPPFIYRSSDDGGTGQNALMKAAMDGNLGRLKGIVKSLTKGNADSSAIFALNTNGVNVLHLAASAGHLEVCKYLVEELEGDVNASGCGDVALGATPLMTAAQSGDVPTVKYLVDHGGDLRKADDKGRTVLHHAASAGSCKVTEFILSKGVPVDIDCGRGTPLYMAATNEQDKTLKILLDHHANPNIILSGAGVPLLSALIYRSLKCMKLLIKAGADVNCKGCMITPLVLATMHGGYTNYIKLLLKAGADPNIPDDLGRLPIEYAALRDCKEEVEMLLPVTTPIPNAPDWSIEGVISHAKTEDKKPIEQRHLERRTALIKSQADTAFRQKEYKMASKFYGLAIDHGESAALYANRSLCKLLMGDGDGALSDALKSRMMRPKWAKACFRQAAAAHMLLKEYKQACDALEDAQELDPGNTEIDSELRKARELMKNPPGDGEQ